VTKSVHPTIRARCEIDGPAGAERRGGEAGELCALDEAPGVVELGAARRSQETLGAQLDAAAACRKGAPRVLCRATLIACDALLPLEIRMTVKYAG